MNKPVEYIDLSAVRRIGASIEFTPREWLPSMFRRVGQALDSSAADIFAWCGLNALPSAGRQKIGNLLTEEVARAIHLGLGVDADTLPTMVMGHLPEELEAFRVNGTFAQSKNWTRGGGTRYCPTCHRVATVVVLRLRTTQRRPPRLVPRLPSTDRRSISSRDRVSRPGPLLGTLE
jgi:hypothetical protein